jgi:hypothetical protein
MRGSHSVFSIIPSKVACHEQVERSVTRRMAEKEGFEPPVPLLVQLISSQSHSATLPLLLTKVEEEKLI